MKHLPSILWFLSWPLVIYLTYRLTILALRIFEKNAKGEEEKAQ